MTPEELEAIKALVERQANDEALWFEAHTIGEAYVQFALSHLHAVIEGDVEATKYD